MGKQKKRRNWKRRGTAGTTRSSAPERTRQYFAAWTKLAKFDANQHDYYSYETATLTHDVFLIHRVSFRRKKKEEPAKEAKAAPTKEEPKKVRNCKCFET